MGAGVFAGLRTRKTVARTRDKNVVLISDSTLGLVWRLDTRSGIFEQAIKAQEMSIPTNASYTVGINGLHIQGDYLYFTNSARGALYRVQIDCDGFAVQGAEVEVVYVSGGFMDAFTFRKRGGVWVTTDPENTVLAIGEEGGLEGVVGGSGEVMVEGATACGFGRGRDDKEVLFVVTNGGLDGAINGTVVTGGKVVAVDTRGIGV